MNNNKILIFLGVIIIVLLVVLISAILFVNLSKPQKIILEIAPPSGYSEYEIEGKVIEAQGDVRVLKIALESYYKNHSGKFPPINGYQDVLLQAKPQIIEGYFVDFFSGKQYKLAYSPNSIYYVIYSVGTKHNGVVTVNNSGIVKLINDPIWESNGHL